MRRYSKKAHYHTIRDIKIFLLFVTFCIRSELVHGQMGGHHSDYEISSGIHDGVNGSREDDDLSNDSNTNGEILVPKAFPLSAQEPTCEELRAMWIFSKRQSRAAEISNEIPTYRDPFTYNVWEPIYPTSRGIGSRMISRFRESSRPVFGRVISREPVVVQRLPLRTRVFDEVPRLYGSETRSAVSALPVGLGPRRYLQYRFSGTPYNSGTAGNPGINNANVVHQGSFQKLKELIWTERAKELTQQRKAEEMAARAAALKEIIAGQHINTHLDEKDGPASKEDNVSPDHDQHYQHNTDSRMSIFNGQSGVVKSLFTGNPSLNSARSARLLLPSMVGEENERGNSPKNFPMRPSHFRERNRVLFRQSSPSDYYQRESRGHVRPKQDASKLNQLNFNARIYSSAEDRSTTHLPYDNELQSTGIQRQLGDLYKKLFQLNNISYSGSFPHDELSDDNDVIEGDPRRREDRFSNDYSEIGVSNDNSY